MRGKGSAQAGEAARNRLSLWREERRKRGFGVGGLSRCGIIPPPSFPRPSPRGLCSLSPLALAPPPFPINAIFGDADEGGTGALTPLSSVGSLESGKGPTSQPKKTRIRSVGEATETVRQRLFPGQGWPVGEGTWTRVLRYG